jgi:hypothetical protein
MTRNVEPIRKALFWLLVTGLVGTGCELLLMGHTEDLWQLIPLLLIGISLAALCWHRIAASAFTLNVVRLAMLLSVVSGVVGAFLHYRGNVEFELERMPGLGGLALFQQAMTGATPPLAPGTMILLGALGLVYSYRHPGFNPKPSTKGIN